MDIAFIYVRAGASAVGLTADEARRIAAHIVRVPERPRKDAGNDEPEPGWNLF